MRTKSKTILLVGWFFYPQMGGVETILYNQAICLSRRNYRVVILTSPYQGRPQQEQLEDIKIIRRQYMRSDQPYPLNRLRREFNSLLEEIQPDIIHFHNGSYPAAALTLESGAQKVLTMFQVIRERQVAVVEQAHNAQLRQPKATKPLRYLDWDYVIFVSQFVQSEWRKRGCAQFQSGIIYDGIDIDQYRDASPEPELKKLAQNGDKIIFFPTRVTSMTTGKIGEQKNFPLLLKACARLKQKDNNRFKLVAINACPLDNNKESSDQLNYLIKADNLSDEVILISPIDLHRMPNYYAAADIVCVPSYNETFGLVYLEAMAAGRIVIASATGAPPEYIRNGRNGFLVDPNDVYALAGILEAAIKGSLDFRSISDGARKTAENFTLEKMVNKIEQTYKIVWKGQDNETGH